jgi:hypothetical protein
MGKSLFRALAFDCRQYADRREHARKDMLLEILYENDAERTFRHALEVEEMRTEIGDLAEAYAEIEEQREDVEMMAEILREEGLSIGLFRLVSRMGILAAAEAGGLAVPDLEAGGFDAGNEAAKSQLCTAMEYVAQILARNASQAASALASRVAALRAKTDVLSTGVDALLTAQSGCLLADSVNGLCFTHEIPEWRVLTK